MENSRIKQIINAYLDNPMPSEIRRRFAEWLLDEADRDEKENVLQNYWEGLESVDTLDRNSRLERLHRDMRSFVIRRALKRAAVAAAAIVAIIGIDFVVVNRWVHNNSSTAIVTTAYDRGEHTLPDGSRIWLNAGSVLRYRGDFQKGNRVVELEGEGFFSVSHNAERPFILKTENMDIEVLGTEFDVINYEKFGKTEVVLCNGSIRACHGKLPRPVTMVPGDRLVYDTRNGLTSLSKVNADNYSRWFKDTLAFDDTSLLDILTNLERRYAVEIEVPKSWADGIKMSFTVRHDESLEEILRAMSLVVDMRYVRNDHRITVIPQNKSKKHN